MISAPFRITVLLLGLALPAFGADRPITVAVCDFRGFYAAQRKPLSDALIANLAKDPRLVLLDRGELNRVLDEQALDLSQEHIDAATAAQVGRLTGAAIIVTGHMARIGEAGRYTVAARLTSTANGRVFGVESVGQHGGGHNFNLPDVAATLAREIGDAVVEHASDLLGPTPLTRDELIAAAVRAAPPAPHPAVALHFQDSSTAETEFGLILERAGFTIVDAGSAQKPAIEIVGDVIATTGDKHGSIYPAQATVNVKVRLKQSSAILLFDRESKTAAGLGQQSAADAAVESAVDTLAARVLPKLVISSPNP